MLCAQSLAVLLVLDGVMTSTKTPPTPSRPRSVPSPALRFSAPGSERSSFHPEVRLEVFGEFWLGVFSSVCFYFWFKAQHGPLVYIALIQHIAERQETVV